MAKVHEMNKYRLDTLYRDMYRIEQWRDDTVMCGKHVCWNGKLRTFEVPFEEWVDDEDDVIWCKTCEDNVYEKRQPLEENPYCLESMLRMMHRVEEADRARDERLVRHKAEDEAKAAQERERLHLLAEKKDPRGNKRKLQLNHELAGETDAKQFERESNMSKADVNRIVGLRVKNFRKMTPEEAETWHQGYNPCCDWVLEFDDGTTIHKDTHLGIVFDLNPDSYKHLDT